MSRMIPSAQAIAEWQPELTWNLTQAARILAELTQRGTDPPYDQAERRATLTSALAAGRNQT